jgi:hypothetical protein
MPFFTTNVADSPAAAKQRLALQVIGGIAMLALIAGLFTQNHVVRGLGIGLGLVWAVANFYFWKKRNV